MDVERALKPVFTDASGRRVAVLRWLTLGLSTCFALVAGAVAFTFLTQVSLPSLGALAGPQTGVRPPATAHAPAADGELAFDAAKRSLSKTPTASGAAPVGSQPPSGSVAPAVPRAGEGGSAAGASRAVARAPRSASHTAPRTGGEKHDATRSPTTTRPNPPVKAGQSPGTTNSGHGHGAPATSHKPEKHHKPHKATGRHHGQTHAKPEKHHKPHRATGRHHGKTHANPHKTEKHRKPHKTEKHRKPHKATGSHHDRTPKSTHPGRSSSPAEK